MKPTVRSSVPSCNAAASAGVAVKVTSAGSAGAPSPRSTTAASEMRAQPRAWSFFPAATTNSTMTGPCGTTASGTIDGPGPESGEQIIFELAFGHAVVDQRPHERELLPREDLADDVVGEAHPMTFGIDLRAVREQRRPPLVQVVADIYERRELVLAIGVEAAFEPR